MRCPGRASLRKAAERGAATEEAEGVQGGPFSFFLHGGRHAKANPALPSGMRCLPRPRARAPHLYTMRPRPLTQWVAPGRGRGPKRQVEAPRRDLREGKGHQGPTDHYEVKNVPEVAEVGTLVQDEPQVNHLRGQKRQGSGRSPPSRGVAASGITSSWTDGAEARGPRGGVRSPHPWELAPHER